MWLRLKRAALLALLCGSVIGYACGAVAPPGYQPAPGGNGQIEPCPPGTAERGPGDFSCLKCLNTAAPGGPRYQPLAGQTKCLVCGGPGGVTNAARTSCVPGPGYQPAGTNKEPTACPRGSAKGGVGAFSCSPCAPNPAQRYQNQTGRAHCLNCPAGSYANAAFTACGSRTPPPPPLTHMFNTTCGDCSLSTIPQGDNVTIDFTAFCDPPSFMALDANSANQPSSPFTYDYTGHVYVNDFEGNTIEPGSDRNVSGTFTSSQDQLTFTFYNLTFPHNGQDEAFVSYSFSGPVHNSFGQLANGCNSGTYHEGAN